MATNPTRIRKSHKGRLYLREHRKALDISATKLAGRLGIARESVLRVEREQWRLDTEEKRLEWAAALGKPLEELRSPPGEDWAPSIDALVEGKPVEIQKEAYQIVKMYLKRA